jgi:hypothetical protein
MADYQIFTKNIRIIELYKLRKIKPYRENVFVILDELFERFAL